MKAFILNSGRGNRMNKLTDFSHKSMVKLSNGETIFERQLRILSECGITDFIVTTGYLKDQLIVASKKFASLNFVFVDNPKYDTTNYIYSMYLADEYLCDDMLLLHGDLVFNKQLIENVLKQNGSVCLFNERLDLPIKDFKGRVENGLLKEVSVDIYDSDCYAFQPLYKLSKEHIIAWRNEIRNFVRDDDVQVYAENALNRILNDIEIHAFSYRDDYLEEIDTDADLQRVSEEIRWFDYREQEIYFDCSFQDRLIHILDKNKVKKVFVVASSKFRNTLTQALADRDISFVSFSNYSLNPKYEEVKEGLDLFNAEQCDFIISIGGGSCIDTAKCIKIFSALESELNFLDSKYVFSNVKHLTIPTTAGTGSESTRFAVIYYSGVKQSVMHDSILPDYVILDHSLLLTLPEYHKKSAMLDALCQAIESFWAKSSTAESRSYSKKAIKLFLDNYKNYLYNDEEACKNMLSASNFSGKAINISTTTAPHAMSYMLTSLYGISHGHAVGLCLPYVWKYMYDNSKNPDLIKTFSDIAKLLECEGIENAIIWFKEFYRSLGFSDMFLNDLDIPLLMNSINAERLSNNPMILSNSDVANIYTKLKSSGSLEGCMTVES